MYQSSEGGLFGATGEIWPKKPEGWRDCQECGNHYYADGDYLCADCREVEDDTQRRWNEQPYEIYGGPFAD